MTFQEVNTIGEKAHNDLFLTDNAILIGRGESNCKRIFATEASTL